MNCSRGNRNDARSLTSSVYSERSARDRLKTASLPPTRMDPASESSSWKKSGDDLRDVGVENRKAKPARGREEEMLFNVADGRMEGWMQFGIRRGSDPTAPLAE